MTADFSDRTAPPRVITIVDGTARNYHPRLSPDGGYLAFDSDRDGVRGIYERCDLAQQPAPQAVAEFCEAPTLVIVETQPPSLKTDPEHTILFAKKRDCVLVFTLSPRAEHCQDELERRHGRKFTSEMVDR